MATIKLTREQKTEIARAERQQQQVAEFKRMIAKERAKKIYDDKIAFATEDPTAMALWELVREYRSARKQLRSDLDGMQRRLTEALQRIDAGETASWSSSGVFYNTAEYDRNDQKVNTLREAIARLAWGLGYYVDDITSQRDRERRELKMQVDVVATGGGYALRRTLSADAVTWFKSDTMTWENEGTLYSDEVSAYRAFSLLVNDFNRID